MTTVAFFVGLFFGASCGALIMCAIFTGGGDE